jgi:hypothetical protein
VVNLEEIEREAERLAVFQVQKFPPYFGQVPDELLTSKRVCPGAKALYGLLHKYAPEKHLKDHPLAEVAQETLADDFGVIKETIQLWLKELTKEGWIEPIHRGKKLVNQYVLYPMSKKTFEAWVAMKRVQLKINRDCDLAKRLRESLGSNKEAKLPSNICNLAKCNTCLDKRECRVNAKG